LLALPPAGAASALGLPGSTLIGPGDAGGAIDDALVRLSRGARLAGRVLGDDGLPPPAAEVMLRAVHQSASASLATTLADAEGFFAFADAPVGGVVVQASATGYRPDGERVELGAEGAAEVTLTLTRAFELSARVEDEDGAGIAGIAVRLTLDPDSAEAAALEEAGGRGMRSLAFTDPFGRATFDRLTRGTWIPTVHSADWELARAEPALARMPGDERLVLELRARPRPPLGVVAGEVWPEDGGEIDGLRIGGVGRGAVLATEGRRFELRGVDPGELTLTFEADGRVPEARGPVELLPGARLELGRIDLAPGTRVTVRVVSAEDEPIAGARVVLRPVPPAQGGARTGARTWRLEERGKGRYRGDSIPRAAWQLRVTREGFRGHSEALTVRETDSQEVLVRLTPR
jgi:hypothetical protein